MSDHCTECFPEAAELARLAENAQAGRSEAFVGSGDPDTVLSCPHGQWRLGDAMAEPPRACQALTAAGEPCKGRPGDDGFCAAHKPKEGESDAGAVPADLDADPPAEEGGQAEAQDGGEEAGSQESTG